MPAQESYAQLILPLAVKGLFTYRIPEAMQGKIFCGSRVLVSFGRKKLYTALVHSLLSDPPPDLDPKDILEIMDEKPCLSQEQIQLWEWISAYYMCSMGEVMRAALPSGLRPENETRVSCNRDWEDQGKLEPQERLLLEVIREEGEVHLGDLHFSGISANPLHVLNALLEKGAVEIQEHIKHLQRKKKVSYVALAPAYQRQEVLHQALDGLKHAPRQREILELLIQLLGPQITDPEAALKKKDLPVGKGANAALSALIRKEILTSYEREEGEAAVTGRVDEKGQPVLNENQQKALEQIRKDFEHKQTVLLQGVTSSGKTEIYIRLMDEAIASGRQVLYLLPEIALTTQIITRIRIIFGSRVGVYHSRYNDSERVHVYRNLLGWTDEEPYQILIGVRSALFLPFRKLGLVIIDEEHEHTYKQQDPAPRYHARDTAQVLALYHDARVLMGTATPSFESLYNAKSGKYGLVDLPHRFGPSLAPVMQISDLRQAMKRKQLRSHLGPELQLAIRETLDRGEQIILFQNRRGYANYLFCSDCMHIPKCVHCDVSLTYHRISNKLECHYCGYQENLPVACPSCGSTHMVMKGFGTEKMEEEIAALYQGIRVARLDTDTARSLNRTQKLIRDFEAGELDLLVGTQMLSKGLDFSRLSLVGVLDADSMLHFPDFRAFEHSYQLISQVGGRAGRREKQGKVIIQTMDPGHPVIQYILHSDYEGLYREQMEERQLFAYPPFRRMIRIRFRHKIPPILDAASDLAARELRAIFSSRVLGPQYPPVRKVQGYFVKFLILKIEREVSHERVRTLLHQVLDQLADREVFRQVRITLDVDPY